MQPAKIEKPQKPSSKIQIGPWNLSVHFQDGALELESRSIFQKHYLHQQFNQVPQQFASFCENLEELKQLLCACESLSINENFLVVPCEVGKKKKDIKVNLTQKSLPLEDLLTHKDELLAKKDQQLNKKDQQVNKLKGQIHQLKYELEKQITKRKEAEEIISNFNLKYRECTKWGCQVQIPKQNIRFYGRSGPICCNECNY